MKRLLFACLVGVAAFGAYTIPTTAQIGSPTETVAQIETCMRLVPELYEVSSSLQAALPEPTWQLARAVKRVGWRPPCKRLLVADA